MMSDGLSGSPCKKQLNYLLLCSDN